MSITSHAKVLLIHRMRADDCYVSLCGNVISTALSHPLFVVLDGNGTGSKKLHRIDSNTNTIRDQTRFLHYTSIYPKHGPLPSDNAQKARVCNLFR